MLVDDLKARCLLQVRREHDPLDAEEREDPGAYGGHLPHQRLLQPSRQPADGSELRLLRAPKQLACHPLAYLKVLVHVLLHGCLWPLLGGGRWGRLPQELQLLDAIFEASLMSEAIGGRAR